MTDWLEDFDCPTWLRIDGEVRGARAQELVQRYIAFVEGTLQLQAPPDEVWLRFESDQGRLKITINTFPVEQFAATQTMLAWVAREFERMSDDAATTDDREAPSLASTDLLRDALEASLLEQEKPPVGYVQVFKCDRRAFEDGGRSLGRDVDVASKVKRILERLSATGFHRKVVEAPLDWQERVAILVQDFPAFRNVVEEVVRPHLTLRAMGIDHRLPPILLVGPPGVGKTYFATALARALGVESPLFVSIASESNGAALAGSSSFWSNSSPGQLFELLAWGRSGQEPCANPAVVLDELDKPTADRYSPLGALYSLLERHTAARFKPCRISRSTRAMFG